MIGLMIAAALLCTVVGFVLGRITKARSVKIIEKAAADPKPICGCTHHLAYHNPKTGRCMDHCKCRRYVGPEVNMGFYHPGVAFKTAAQITKGS